MSDVANPKKTTRVRRQRSIYQVHYCLERRCAEEMKPLVLTSDLDVQAYHSQVAGHKNTDQYKYTGLLQCNNGTILKPILKPSQEREVAFYSRLQGARHPELAELRSFVPRYFGRTTYAYNHHQLDYIVLEDLTQGMLEQCVMDVKIGKRTWDPLATEEKIKSEQTKYALCKQEFGFCIPGYQVYELATGRLLKYGKEHGKKLHGHMVKDAIRKYLNSFGSSLCRALLLQLLAGLWRIQKWARAQTSVRLYCTSLLLLYDAAKLRDCCAHAHLTQGEAKCRPAPLRRHSVHSVEGGGPLGGQLGARGPRYPLRPPRPRAPPAPAPATAPAAPPRPSPWAEAYDKLTSYHSFDHNFEDNLSKMKVDYRTLLDRLSGDAPNPNTWGTVKIIDFAHAFFNDDDDVEPAVDDNFREGIDNFVAIFESFLAETEEC